MPISLKVKTVFHCKCIYCGWEWDADKKPKRCARHGCKLRGWNGEDHRLVDPYGGRRTAIGKFVPLSPVPVPSQIENGTEAPRPPSSEALLDSLVKVRGIIAELIAQNPCRHSKGECVCAEIEVLAEVDQQIEKLRALKPLRSTYLARKKRREEVTA
jgi:hypothetical protein